MNNKNVLISVSVFALYLLFNFSSLRVVKFILFSHEKFSILDQYEKANFISPVLRIILLIVSIVFVYLLREIIRKTSLLENLISIITVILSMEILVSVVESTFKYYQLSQSEMVTLGLVNFTEPYKLDMIQKIGALMLLLLVYFLLKKLVLNKKPNIA